MNFEIDKNLLIEFEKGLNTRYPEKSKISAKIIGYGEISTVILIENSQLNNYAFKRITIFSNEREIEEYNQILKRYIEILNNKTQIEILPTLGIPLNIENQKFVYYIAQPILPKNSICNYYFHQISIEESLKIFDRILQKLLNIYKWNLQNKSLQIGIDSQISNWAILNSVDKIIYFDVSTPLFRIDNKEALKADMFLRSTPPILRTIVKKLFLQEVLDRYYDLRLILIDLIANFYKEKLQDRIPIFIQYTNEFLLKQSKEYNLKEIRIEEIKDYYKKDAFIWKLYLSLRKIDRWVITNILNKKYEFILPEKIER